MGNKSKRLIKFKDQFSQNPIYVNIDEIFSISKSISAAGTSIMSTNGFTVYVGEHISEVLAVIEERSALPAKVLFDQQED